MKYGKIGVGNFTIDHCNYVWNDKEMYSIHNEEISAIKVC